MSKLKYLNVFVAASGATAMVIGTIISVKGAIVGEGAKSWISGLSLMLGGVGLQTIAVDRLLKTQIEEQIDRTLDERLKAIPKACKGCRNFHGIEYGRVRLVCAIHPHGVEGDTCSDHEKFPSTKKLIE
ncbi:hypothetical protein LC608_23445 [Nostoc sp. XA010]|uniref:hypothetical protein n=1 Tax=Nostoc sp. XA010 TaxID=2780407 RepID=UPI001E48568E|nr:hypothetical protein [Nostoc sp. XA010]MCC5659876.1 hypothetical protein [Nostoc sp. XA010]